MKNEGYFYNQRLMVNNTYDIRAPTVAGSLDVPSSAMELDLARAGFHMLIEKPISIRPAEEVHRLSKVHSSSHTFYGYQ